MENKFFKKRRKSCKGERYCGLVDIGSNTVHGVVYRVKADGDIKKVINQKENTELISYVEKNTLTDEGITRLCDVTGDFMQIFKMMNCDCTDFFATSALRNLRNQEQVMEAVRSKSGVNIRIISGDEEAYYDYVSLKNNCDEEDAVGLDLGGGSGQLVEMKQGVLRRSNSMECGCLRMYNNYVEGVFPDESERRIIENKVVRLIEDDYKFKNVKRDTVYLMGGSARAISKFHRSLEGVEKSSKQYCISTEELEKIIKTFKIDQNLCVFTINRLFPDRMCTFLPGVIVIKTIAEYLGAGKVCILKDGIREGVLNSEFLKDNN